jgi:NitT/TauT family transport system ATP-binding protein
METIITSPCIRPMPALTGKEAIVVQSAYHGYYDPAKGRKQTVLHNIDLIVERGEFVALVGPSGCGKSTFLKLVTGQEPVQEAADFDILGTPVGLPDRRRGVVFQNYSLAEHLTVLQNIMLGLEFQAGFLERLSPAWRRRSRDTARRYLETMRLSDAENKFPSELSGGMKQRAAIAQTLVTIDIFGMPELLCMDEPYGALDPGTREDLQIFILKLWEKSGKTVLFVTHDLEEACFLGTRVVVLSQFWKSDIPPELQQGSRIVMDLPLEKHAMSTDVKKTAEFGKLIEYIRANGFNPKQRKHVAEFNSELRHPKSFQTLSFEEDHKYGTFREGGKGI